MVFSNASIWYVTREYAGIAEAGGVKNVACALAEGCARKGSSVLVFIPAYGCVSIQGAVSFGTEISIAGKFHSVSFREFAHNGVRIVLIESDIYREKSDVYVYTKAEAALIQGNPHMQGHFDSDLLNMLLQFSVIQYSILSGLIPDVIHCQDAHTAILPALIRTNPVLNNHFISTKIVVTIHNAGAGYRQIIPGISRAQQVTQLTEEVLQMAFFNENVEPFLLSALYGNLTTVSPWYARELTSASFNHFTEGLSGEFERRHISITGITNGIDFNRYDPRDTSISHLPFSFDPSCGDLAGKYKCRDFFLNELNKNNIPVGIEQFGSIDTKKTNVFFSYHGRIAWQKGITDFVKSAAIVLDSLPEARFLVLGQGDPMLEILLIKMTEKYGGRFLFLRGYERSLARLIVAVSDFLVLPSVFEPCGLEDFIGQIFGTIPVANAVGGLQKILHGKTGFLYTSGSKEEPEKTLASLLLSVASPLIVSGSIGCGTIPAYDEIIRYAALRVKEQYNWDEIIETSYAPIYQIKNNSHA
ncbi:MAG TPA: glycogen/starch synthase [Treponemataceae bacterium]|nr:glycogen/starch synthase [Treponemataceae bacterium]